VLTDPFQVKVICGVATSSNGTDVAENPSDVWSLSDAVEEILIVGDAEVSAAGCHDGQVRDFSFVICRERA
jgi:hypothetical protein